MSKPKKAVGVIMLTKNQNEMLMQSIVKNAKDILNMFRNNEIEKAFIKFESVRDILFTIDLQHIFENEVKEMLLNEGIPETKITGFFVSYCSYRKNKIEIATIEL